MKNPLHNPLLHEEKKATKWFLVLFYGSFIIYDIILTHFLPTIPWQFEVVNTTLFWDYILYGAMIILIPISHYLYKTNRPEWIKYLYFLSYIIINLFTELWFYSNNDVPYSSGNFVEVIIILFSPIFVNKNYFYLVSLGTALKYLLVGLILKNTHFILPLIIVLVITVITFIILKRFISYMETVSNAYDKQLEGIVKGINATLELKDPYTRGHSERVAEYAMILATKTGKFTKNELRYFYYACLLHDIGKIHIPDAILTKSGKLTDEEFNIIKMHTLVGAEAIQNVDGMSDNIDVILHHHERWDGKGYPDGLKGEETSILARITALADAFDAMTSSRSYRAALPLEEAYKRMIEGKGTQFDPQLVDLFKEIYPEWKDIHDKYNNN
ncbi:HD-GYP domain-containing protein [Ornithinibacillus halotolerans]|uniref:HD family phosphohydrolase n=1 Tax=Ornithinibacillus halotolerans TaxID=1274357 RepID=A0A916W4S8_9BACI|nr:HD-GYP domain-containing protein [Ornithinibacillus halotolerans]GGA65481.1 HD family phosphohydrolase [Ornithinibacillus halotolerans]